MWNFGTYYPRILIYFTEFIHTHIYIRNTSKKNPDKQGWKHFIIRQDTLVECIVFENNYKSLYSKKRF